MQVLEQLQVALFLADLPQPLNHQLSVSEVDMLNALYIHCSNYLTPVYMIKQDTVSRVYNDLSGFGLLEQTLQDAEEVDPSIKLDDVRQCMEENTKNKMQLKRP